MLAPLHIKPADSLTPIFGYHALPKRREARRQRAAKAGHNKLSAWYISFCRKQALRGLTQPFDVEIEPRLKARLYPHGNRCEKRAIAGLHHWDAQERSFLKQAILQSHNDFAFLDIGANVGLYSLFAAHYARQSGKSLHIHAIEPDSENRRRLIDNMRANKFKAALWPVAISNTAEELSLQSHSDNRGEIKLSHSANGETVPVTTLTDIISRSGLTKIDFMKLDIEGHDLRALTHLFENTDHSLYPKYLIIETNGPDGISLKTLCYNQGYTVKGKGRLNLMLHRDDAEEN